METYGNVDSTFPLVFGLTRGRDETEKIGVQNAGAKNTVSDASTDADRSAGRICKGRSETEIQMVREKLDRKHAHDGTDGSFCGAGPVRIDTKKKKMVIREECVRYSTV